MPNAPIARRAATADPYAWLEQRDNAEVMDYLRQENAYLEEVLADQSELRESLLN